MQKACKHTFSSKITIAGKIGIYCPHCKYKLQVQHCRNDVDDHVCMNKRCSYYETNLRKKGTVEEKELQTSSNGLRLRYHYRDFNFNLENLVSTTKTMDSKVNLARIHYDSNVLGLILTYYINYGLSSRKTASILRDVHGLRISHQTILNYASSLSNMVKPLVDNYPYQLGNVLAGDETYIKVRGKNQYVFFWFDPVKKIITSFAYIQHVMHYVHANPYMIVCVITRKSLRIYYLLLMAIQSTMQLKYSLILMIFSLIYNKLLV